MTSKIFVSVCLVLGSVFALHGTASPIDLNFDVNLDGLTTRPDLFSTDSDPKLDGNSINADKPVSPSDIRDFSLTQWTAKQEIQPNNETQRLTRVKREEVKKGKGRIKKGRKGKKTKGPKGMKKKKGKKNKKGKNRRKKTTKGKKKGKKKGKRGKKKKRKSNGHVIKKEQKEKAVNSPKLKKIYPVKVKIETVMPVSAEKLKEIEKLKSIKKKTDKSMKIINPCELKPCRHNGICETKGTSIGDYKCVCPIGRKGKHCELSKGKLKAGKVKKRKKKTNKVALKLGLVILVSLILIGLILLIHYLRVKNKRKQMLAEFKRDKVLGKSPTPVPGMMELILCGLKKAEAAENAKNMKVELEKKATMQKLNELIDKVSASTKIAGKGSKKAKGKKTEDNEGTDSEEETDGEEGEEGEEEKEGSEGELEATDEQIEELADTVAEAKLSMEQVGQLTQLVGKVSKAKGKK